MSRDRTRFVTQVNLWFNRGQMVNVNLLMGLRTVKSSFLTYAGVHVRGETEGFISLASLCVQELIKNEDLKLK